MTTLYHGSHTGTITLHEGICLTAQRDVAERYAGRLGVVGEIDIDLDSLVVVRVAGYDHDANYAPADDDEFRAAHRAAGVDVLVYDDEDESGREHACYRLISDRALAACTVLV